MLVCSREGIPGVDVGRASLTIGTMNPARELVYPEYGVPKEGTMHLFTLTLVKVLNFV